MKAEVWARVRPVLDRVLAVPVLRREGELTDACQGDNELLSLVRSVLDDDQSDPDFLSPPAFHDAPLQASASTSLPVPSPLQHCGPWRLHEQLGSGGMGTVYRAERADGAFHMSAAVKLLHPSLLAEGYRKRFTVERDVLARLDHPNIARLLDGGTESVAADGQAALEPGHPWLAMELVRGTPIDRHADEHELSLHARIDLFLKVCDAVEHAHGHLVVHRDIKPANVLVNAEGEPRLLDFGIAGLLSDAGQAAERTLEGPRPLTPRYASPEQLRDEPITTASDTYSLGVLLYELLTGVAPHADRGTSLVQRAAAVNEEPPLASETARREVEGASPPEERAAHRRADPVHLGKALRGDLDVILATALRVDIDSRYASVGALAADLRRYRAQLPIIARPHSAAYRSLRFVQRNRLLVGGVALLVAVLSTSLVLIVQLYLDEGRARGRAERAEARAVSRFDQIRSLAGELMHGLHDEISLLPGATRARATLVETSLRYLDALTQEAGNDQGLLAELSAGYLRMGDVQGRASRASLGDAEAAAASYAKHLELVERQLAQAPDDAGLLEARVHALQRLANVEQRQGSAERALERLQQAEQLVGELDASQAADSPLLVTALIEKADVLRVLGRSAESLLVLERATQRARDLAQADPKNPQAFRPLLMVLIASGELHELTGDLERAKICGADAVTLARTLSKSAPETPLGTRDQAQAERFYGRILSVTGSEQEALAVLASAWESMEGLVLADPLDAGVARDAWLIKNDMARTSARLGELDAAVVHNADAIARVEAALSRHPEALDARRDLMAFLTDGGEFRVARAEPAAATALLERALLEADTVLAQAADDPVARAHRAVAVLALGMVAMRADDAAEALAKAIEFRTQLDAILEQDPANRWAQRMTMVGASLRADAHRGLAEWELACEFYELALQRFEELDEAGLLLDSDRTSVEFTRQGLEDARARLVGA
ncbi:MAG: hypothetical protein DHS20C15_32270 [Planctomycetota bacterium]|nr:MAG: hypothetical protein DHS20C15_32270 [Planctomycetota bacterium]